jgi:hypothetical protein
MLTSSLNATMHPRDKYELEFRAYSPRWKNLTHHLKKAAREHGISLEVSVTDCGLRRIYHCVATGEEEALYAFKERWGGKKSSPTKLAGE